MIGLPTEDDADIEAIRELTGQMRDIMLGHARPKGRVGRIVASVNPLIPKPGTAYQWLPMEDPAITDRKGKRLRALVADLDNVYFNIKSERHSYYQALMSLGDRRVAPAIEAAERNGGNWRAAVAESGVDADFYIFRDRSADAVLPWDIIDGGMKSTFFRNEFDKGLREEWTLPPKRSSENKKFLPVLDVARATRVGFDRRADVLAVGLENQVADPVLRGAVGQRAQQRERSPLAVDGVGARRERHVPAAAGLALPDREPDQLQPLERPVREVELRVRQLPRRIAFFVRHNLDGHVSSGGLRPGPPYTLARGARPHSARVAHSLALIRQPFVQGCRKARTTAAATPGLPKSWWAMPVTGTRERRAWQTGARMSTMVAARPANERRETSR